MKKMRSLRFISLLLLTYLFIESTGQVDFLASMNNAVLTERKTEVDNATRIEYVKMLAKKEMETNRMLQNEESGRALRRICVVLILGAVQLVSWKQTN